MVARTRGAKFVPDGAGHLMPDDASENVAYESLRDVAEALGFSRENDGIEYTEALDRERTAVRARLRALKPTPKPRPKGAR